MLDFFSEWVIWYFRSKFEFEVKFKIKISFFRVLVFLMPKIDILEWSKSVLNHFESVRVHPNSLFLSFGVVRLSRKLFRKYGQARSHQKTSLAQGNTGEGGFWGDWNQPITGPNLLFWIISLNRSQSTFLTTAKLS